MCLQNKPKEIEKASVIYNYVNIKPSPQKKTRAEKICHRTQWFTIKYVLLCQ